MRVNDVPTTTVNGVRGQYSLLMTWIETVTAEMMRLYVYPARPSIPLANAAQYHLAHQDHQARRPRPAIHQPPNPRPVPSQHDMVHLR
jgi:hypothetical protein